MRLLMWDDRDLFKNHESNSHVDDDDEDFLDDDDDDEKMPGHKMHMIQVPNVVNTPMGLVKLTDNLSPALDTAFSICHTNFTITQEVMKIIEDCPGVEFLKILSRYRCVIGFGHMFIIQDVKDAIEKALEVEGSSNIDSIEQYNSIDKLNDDVQDIIDSIRKKMNKKTDKWIAYIFPNGEYWVKTAKDDATFIKLEAQAKVSLSVSKGVIVTKDEIYQ